MKNLHIARIAHLVNAAYCLALGDASQVDWDAASQAQRDSVLKGVEFVLSSPDAGPAASHEAWLAHKAAEGWAYGEVKDEERKLHPCFVPFESLSVEQRAKDHVFRAVVLAVASSELAEPAPAPASNPVAPVVQTERITRTLHEGKTPVKYIGRRATYVDGTFGTGVRWTQGQTEFIPDAIAIKMLGHPSVYEPGDPSVATTTSVATPETDDASEQALQELRDEVANMDKPALAQFAKVRFNHEFARNASVPQMRAKVTGLIDQYGV